MERQLPKNVRQIGNVCDEPKIYIEDYVDTYLGQLKEKAVENPVAAVLTGEIESDKEQTIVYISGAIEIQGIKITGTEIVVEEEAENKIEQDRKEYFKNAELVGWCLLETGHPMSLNRGAGKLHEKMFPGEHTVFLWKDALLQDEMVFAYKYGDLMQIGGHYIYYEKNPEMQNYMISTRKQNGVTPSEVVEDLAAKNFRNTVRERMVTKEQHRGSRMLYATSTMLVLIVLAIGIVNINHFNRGDNSKEPLGTLVQSEREQKSRDTEDAEEVNAVVDNANVEEVAKKPTEDGEDSVEETVSPKKSKDSEKSTEEDYYTVRKGDTLASISMKRYGDAKHVEAICKMNGLSDGNLIFIGQKLLLP